MNDTTDTVARLVREHHAAMTPAERMRIAASMYDTARAIVEASLPAGLTRVQHRYAVAKRIYGNDLPDAVLLAYAEHEEQ
jgi:hypothetical protein